MSVLWNLADTFGRDWLEGAGAGGEEGEASDALLLFPFYFPKILLVLCWDMSLRVASELKKK